MRGSFLVLYNSKPWLESCLPKMHSESDHHLGPISRSTSAALTNLLQDTRNCCKKHKTTCTSNTELQDVFQY